MILAGDIGGTHTRLALFGDEPDAGLIREETLLSKSHESLIGAVKWFLKGETPQIDAACFGVAGPVNAGRCRMTNLPWTIDAMELNQKLSIPSVTLLNDLEATAFGTLALKEDDFFTLNTGRINPHGNRVVIAAGTGLGEAILFWDGVQHRPFPSEGGHCDFAPRNSVEIGLLSYLLKRYPRVSYERVLSGSGLLNVFRFLEESEQSGDVYPVSERLKKEDPGSVISELALAHQSERCIKALDLFVSIYGAEAGNLALKTLATGGVYVGGGIAPKILEKLKDGTFIKAFLAKGRYASFLKAIPVKVILNDKTALLGAAYKAGRHKVKYKPESD